MNRKRFELGFTIMVLFALFMIYTVISNTQKANAQAYGEDPLQWAADFEGTFGGCCGIDDCFAVEAHILEQISPDKVKVSVNGIQMIVPSKIVHASQDQNGYWCHLTTGALEYGWSPDEFSDGGTGDIPVQDCALGQISQVCAHCIFVVVGN